MQSNEALVYNLSEMTDYLVCMCACVCHGIHAHSLIIESIPDGIKFYCGLYVYYTAGTANESHVLPSGY